MILISLDTLRADRLACYGYPRETTTEFDRFADHAVRFETVCAPTPWTLTSHMSLLRLSCEVPTLANLFHEAGYETAALVDVVPWQDGRHGFAHDFDAYRHVFGGAERKIRTLAPLLDDLGGGPFFLFLHFFGVHSDSVILVTADHGEELADHGGFLHSSLYEECLRVPLLVRTPDTGPAEGQGLVALIDVPATLLELCGLDASGFGGESSPMWSPGVSSGLRASRSSSMRAIRTSGCAAGGGNWSVRGTGAGCSISRPIPGNATTSIARERRRV